MAYQYSGVGGRFASGITNPAQNRLLRTDVGLAKPMSAGPYTGHAVGGGMGVITPGGSSTVPQYGRIYNYGLPGIGGDVGVWGDQTTGPSSTHSGFITPGSKNKSGARFGWEDQFPEYQAAPDRPTMAGADYVGAEYTAYDPRLWTDQPNVNTKDIVDANRYMYEDEMAQNMGTAARRFGASGATRSSGAASALGAAERKMFQDINALGMKYGYDASQQDANRSLQAFSDFERRRAAEAARKTGFSQTEANRQTGFNVGQQGATNAFNWQDYMAGLSEADRQQAYDMLKYKFGV